MREFCSAWCTAITMYIKGRKQIEDDLAKRRQRLFTGNEPELLDALLRNVPSLSDAIIVGHIPEQCEDLFAVLVDADRVALVEIAREPEKHVTSFTFQSADEYGRGLSPRSKRQFLVAREVVGSRRGTLSGSLIE